MDSNPRAAKHKNKEMKKFYKTVAINPLPNDGYALLLDGKPVRTPAKQDLKILSLPLATSIADEWNAQRDEILPDTMPLSQMAMTLVDRVLPQRDHLTNEILNYLDTDLTCYRAAEPEEFKTAQETHWNPFIDWIADNFAIRPATTTGLAPLTQPPELHQKIAAAVAQMTDTEFMALYLTTLGSGSLIMALAFVAGQFPPDRMISAAFVEETIKDKIYMADIYGSAPDQERRIKALTNDLDTLQRFLMLSAT